MLYFLGPTPSLPVTANRFYDAEDFPPKASTFLLLCNKTFSRSRGIWKAHLWCSQEVTDLISRGTILSKWGTEINGLKSPVEQLLGMFSKAPQGLPGILNSEWPRVVPLLSFLPSLACFPHPSFMLPGIIFQMNYLYQYFLELASWVIQTNPYGYQS